ncbi:MAG: hypothetical protein HQ567_19290 [Candidatus Nealsonbacteria bacterium]|nr:hypothetical protein [Candidatus Nealsonbacteria bacterium]
MTADASAGIADDVLPLRPAVDLRRWSAVATVALLGSVALLIGWRRLAGALDEPLSPPSMLLTGALLAVACVGVRLAWPRAGLFVWLSCSACVAAIAVAVSLPRDDWWATAGLWLFLVIEESWAWRPAGRRTARRDGPAPPPEVLSPEPSVQPPCELQPDSPAETLAEGVLQQFTRTRAADGSERLSGWLRAPFLAGQRTASVHVAFCPPFAVVPELSVEQVDGPPARVKTAQLLPQGARLDLKLASAAEEPHDVALEFSALASSERATIGG